MAGIGATAFGGVGTASAKLPDGATVGALVVVNAAGSTVDLATGELWAARHCLPGDLPQMHRPDLAELAAAHERSAIPGQLATTLAVIATDATLTKAQCQKVSGIGHDGMARAIDPVHTMFDGDTVFTLATGDRPAPDAIAFHALLATAATTVTRAIASNWMPSLATAETFGVSSTRGLTDIATATSTLRPARSIAAAREKSRSMPAFCAEISALTTASTRPPARKWASSMSTETCRPAFTAEIRALTI